MKFTIKITYANQTAYFRNVEIDDEELSDEMYMEGYDLNSEIVEDDFLEKCVIEIERE